MIESVGVPVGTNIYLLGRDPAKWQTAVPSYAQVRYRQIYSGVTLTYYGEQAELEYSFVISPWSDGNQIAMQFDGDATLQIDGEGWLTLSTPAGVFLHHKPVAYQE